MIDIAVQGTNGMRMTSKMIVEQAIARGWSAQLYYQGSSQLQLKRPDGTTLELHSATPPSTSLVSASRADDKYFTTLFLSDHGLPVLETHLITNDEEAFEVAKELFAAGKQCVVKPLDAGHGNGITVAVSTPQQLAAALNFAREHSSKLLVQEYLTNRVDIRLSYVDYKFVAALVRNPARVQGDGVHTVAELIKLENSAGKRGENYSSKLNRISERGAEIFLSKAVLEGIPKKDEWVQVVGTANVGTGGETIDVTDDIPDWLHALGEQAARSMMLPVCGVDFLLRGTPTAQASQQELQPVIIELNQCPALFMHELPVHGKPQPIIAAFLDYLETL